MEPSRAECDRRVALLSLMGLVAGCATEPTRTDVRFSEQVVRARDGRDVRLRIARPGAPTSALGYLVFSHGANSSGALYDPVLRAFANGGFIVVAPTHVDSEAHSDRALYGRDAVERTRQEDLKLAVDMAPAIVAAAGVHARHFDLSAAAVAGHSYGALTALQKIGALRRAPDGQLVSARDQRFRCALAISPPGPVAGFLAEEQFDAIDAPFMITTGDRDVLPGFVDDWRARLAPLERARVRPRFGVILPDVDHYFGGLIGRLTTAGPPAQASLDVTLWLATLFLRASALRDEAAGAALRRAAVAPGDIAHGLQIISR